MTSIPMNHVFHAFKSTFSSMAPPLRLHLRNVYASLMIATIAATAGGAATLYTKWFDSFGLLTTIGSFVLLGMILFAPDNEGKNQTMRLGYLTAFAALTGINMNHLLNYVAWLDPSIIVTALMGTALVFTSFTLCAMFARDGKWLYLGSIIASVFNALMMMSVASIFFGMSGLFYQARLYVGLAAICACVLYDTQLIIVKHGHGSRDAVAHAMELFVDLVGIFRHILVILADNEDNRRKRRQ